jgi:hypothetical protein
MVALATLFAGLLAFAATPVSAPTSSPAATPTASPGRGGEPIILFLIDNSASLPPLDPYEKRVAALEKMFTFLQGQRYRLVLFGGRREIYIDDVSRYRNNGQWTDFYFAFEKARELTKGYPAGTEFRIILLTDAIADPAPDDWADMNVPPGEDLRAFAIKKTIELATSLKIPLYVILVGDPPADVGIKGNREQAPALVMDLVRSANGQKATPLAQTLASFFGDDGVLLKKFIFRAAPGEGLRAVEPIVKRIVAPPRVGIEIRILSYFVLPLLLALVGLLGLLVRSFPGPGDVETVELSLGIPAHVAVDRARKGGGGVLVTTGLSLVNDARDAAATLAYQMPTIDLSGVGLNTAGLDETTQYLLPLGIEDLRRTFEAYAVDGTKEEKIYALNLDYMAKNMAASEAERIMTMAPADRRRIQAVDFLRAKAHLIGNDALRRKLTDPRVQLIGYGKNGVRKELLPGAAVRIGRYGFVVKDISRGGRKDARIVLYYDRVPSLLWLKTVLPDAFQRAFRFRRSSQRVVS